ncbi:hypothetical protein ACOYR1_02495 [Thalassotalea piscium]
MTCYVKFICKLSILIGFINPLIVNADEFIGQWHIFQDNNFTVAQTIDGLNTLQIRVNPEKTIEIVFSLHDFLGFGTKHEVFEYRSPTYGKIRTVDYYIEQNQVTLRTPYEVNRFIENLKDIATHPMLLDSNLGSSFKDRKISISYLSTEKKNALDHAAFSTIEIDEILQSLGI